MAKEGELKRVDLKVNVSCCDGCRRKVMKAMSLKGVLRTEIHPTLDRVTVVGNVDTALLVRKLAKVRKIAEVVEPASPEDKKKREDQPHGRAQDRDGGDWTAPPAPVMAGENSKRKDDGGDWTAPAPVMAGEKSKSKGDGKDSSGEKPSSKKECHKCAQQQQKQQSARGGDHGDHGKAPSTKGDAESAFKEERDGFAAEAKPSPPDHAPAAAHQNYHRAEPPSMAVPMQYMPTTPYYAAAASVAAPSYYNGGGGGYYAMPPPPPPVPTMPMQQQQQLVRAQPSRFDVDYFNEDNAVGCHVM